MDRGAWQATVHGVAKSQTRPKELNMHSNSYQRSPRVKCTEFMKHYAMQYDPRHMKY